MMAQSMANVSDVDGLTLTTWNTEPPSARFSYDVQTPNGLEIREAPPWGRRPARRGLVSHQSATLGSPGTGFPLVLGPRRRKPAGGGRDGRLLQRNGIGAARIRMGAGS